MEPQTIVDPYYKLIATVHGISGLVIFITGILQFIMKKGGRVHRIIGRVYLYTWIAILITGAYIGSMLIVAIVLMGFYLSVTGVRLAVLRGKPFEKTDKAIIIVALAIVLFMIYAAIVLTVKQNYTYAIIATFFALLYSWVITRDVLTYIFKKEISKNKYGRMAWYVNHLSRMQFSFLTAVAAFTAVQNVFGNTVLNFILPAVIGFIAVRRSRSSFVKKLKIHPVIVKNKVD